MKIKKVSIWLKLISMAIFGAVGWLVVPDLYIIQLILLVIGYNIPEFLDYLRMDPKRLLKFHRGDYGIKRDLAPNELEYFAERMMKGKLILDDRDNDDPSLVAVNASIWDTLSDEEKEIFRYLISQYAKSIGLEFKGIELKQNPATPLNQDNSSPSISTDKFSQLGKELAQIVINESSEIKNYGCRSDKELEVLYVTSFLGFLMTGVFAQETEKIIKAYYSEIQKMPDFEMELIQSRLEHYEAVYNKYSSMNLFDCPEVFATATGESYANVCTDNSKHAHNSKDLLICFEDLEIRGTFGYLTCLRLFCQKTEIPLNSSF